MPNSLNASVVVAAMLNTKETLCFSIMTCHTQVRGEGEVRERMEFQDKYDTLTTRQAVTLQLCCPLPAHNSRPPANDEDIWCPSRASPSREGGGDVPLEGWE